MKRLIIFIMLLCIMLCSCENEKQVSSSKPDLESNPSVEEKVTVYMVTKVACFDSGFIEYHYDENNNIDYYTVFNIENDVLSNVSFEEKDSNGMARVIRTLWEQGGEGDRLNIKYYADGRIKEEQISESNYTGLKYEYNKDGNITAKREYYEGILESAIYFEYDEKQLVSAYCEDKSGNKLFECRSENGLIVEKVYFDADEEYGYYYKYDDNNNLVETTVYYEGETTPGDCYFYKAVEVDAKRAAYLKEQQKYLISII